MICCIPSVAQPRPFLSICIPTWNRSAKLQALLLGLIAYLSDAIEIVIVDNGSEDDTLDAVRRIAADHPQARISLWANEVNLGADVNYLRALELGSGEWLWLLGDDEQIEPAKIGHLRKSLADCEDLAIVRLKRWKVSLSLSHHRLESAKFLSSEFDEVGDSLHKIGLFLLRKEATLPFFKQAYAKGIGNLHSYSLLSLGMISSGAALDIIEVPGLYIEASPETAEQPRWNELIGTLGAWRTSEIGLVGRKKLASEREIRIRMRGVFAIVVYQLATGNGVEASELRWLFKAVPVSDKAYVLGFYVISKLPRPIAKRIAKRVLDLKGHVISYSTDKIDY